MIFHVSNLNTRVLNPPPTRISLMQTVGRFDMWVTPKTNKSSFWVFQNFLMHCMVCSVCYLGCVVVNINELFAEWRITEGDLFLISFWRHGTHCIFTDIDACENHFLCFGKYIFHHLQICSAVCTEDAYSSNTPSNFSNFLVFNVPFFNFER